MAGIKRVRKLRSIQRGDLQETLKLVREAEFTIDTGAGSLGRPGTLKSTETAKGVVERVLASRTSRSHHPV